MSITVTCGKCGTKAEVPASAAGMKGKCEACGGIVRVPGTAKLCCVCGVDVSGHKRAQDQQGNYYCGPCWGAKAHVIATQRRERQQTTATPDGYGCSVCRQLFAADQVYGINGDFICHECYASRSSQARRANTLPQPQGRHFSPAPVRADDQMPLLSCAICGGSFTYAYLRNVNGRTICIECDDARRARSAATTSRSSSADRANRAAVFSASAWWVLIGLAVVAGVITVISVQWQQQQVAERNQVAASESRDDTARKESEARATQQRDEEDRHKSANEQAEKERAEQAVRNAPRVKTRAQRVDEDPVLQSLISHFPDLERPLKNREYQRVSTTIQQLILTDQISYDVAKYVNNFNYSSD